MMEDPLDEKTGIREPLVLNIQEEKAARYDLVGSSSARNLHIKPSSAKGGFRTLPFIFANEALLDVANYGVMPNMIIYLVKKYGMETADATQVLFLWSATIYSSPSLCALIADSYTGKFWMIAFGCLVSVLGMILLWLSAMIPQATPCHDNACAPQTVSQLSLLYASLFLISVGAGGIRSSTAAFGADQLTTSRKYGIKNARVLEKYFGWFYFFSSAAMMVAATVMVYIPETWGWRIGFGVAALLTLLSAVSFYLGSALYLKVKAKAGLLTGLAQVLVASYRKRHIKLSSSTAELNYHHHKGSKLIYPSDNLRLLNKACVIENHEREINTAEEVCDPWSLCTVEQVEELKSLIRVIPLWSSGIIFCMTITQTTFITLQALSMDRHLTPNFEIPAASLYMFHLTSLILWIALYDRALIPIATKIMRKPVRLSTRQRMGIGHVFAFLSMVVAAFVERYRRNMSITEARLIGPQSTFPVSSLWLAPQYVLMGIANALSAVAQTEFYYSELPKSMSSIASSLFAVGLSAGSVVSSFLVSIIDRATESGGSWVSTDINDGHYDYYYWLLAGLNVVNYVYFLACCRAYGPVKQPVELVPGEVERMVDEQDL
uniref:Uncharacterized protein n=1 Tax=Kalanchoe fedtschenkoi TaxID=63787 RepID=A0A7N0URN1_KALFE